MGRRSFRREFKLEAVRLVRDFIGRIVVLPAAAGDPLHLEIVGDLAKLMQPHRYGRRGMTRAVDPQETFGRVLLIIRQALGGANRE